MGWFDRFRRAPWSLARVGRPWGDRSSLYEHVRSRIDPKTGRLRDSGQGLPDEDAQSTLKWAPGALDGVLGHHVAGGDEALRTKQIIKALCDLATDATEANLTHLCRISKESTLGIIDDVTGALAERSVDPEHIHEIGRVLASEAPDREVVKLGIALVGIVSGFDDFELLSTLGAHEEFTLFCAVAIGRQSEDPERGLWDLAKRVDGWGRIHIVERLANTESDEIRAWLLREGFRNSVMDEYLAYTCATAGRLNEALRVETVDDALLVGASGIFAALARGGPAQDLGDYSEAENSVARWLGHIERRPVVLEHVEALDALSERKELSPDLRGRIDAFRNADTVRSAVIAGLDADDPTVFGRADSAARNRAIDTSDQHAARFREGRGFPSYHLYRLLQDADETRIDRVLEMAAERIDLERVGSGPATELGLGPGFESHGLLDSIVQELARFPRHGPAFLVSALRSPVIRNRNMALRAVATWGRDCWSDELQQAIVNAAKIEPDEELAKKFERVLAGEPFDEPRA